MDEVDNHLFRQLAQLRDLLLQAREASTVLIDEQVAEVRRDPAPVVMFKEGIQRDDR